MSKIDFSHFYKTKFSNTEELSRKKYDVFISSFNESERVQTIFKDIRATEKYWIVAPEYGFENDELPDVSNLFHNNTLLSESEFIMNFFEKFSLIDKIKSSSFCFDITGFSRPHLIFLVKYLKHIGVDKVDMIYTDPLTYIKNEKTNFWIEFSGEPRQINFCEGSHSADTSNDLLIVGAGYDYKSIASVAESKVKANKVQLFGFPPLKPHMYQENMLQVYKAREAIGDQKFSDNHNCLFAPANDPFITAQILKDFVDKENLRTPITNLYLSPLSTKAQTLGFALYFSWEFQESSSASMIFPISSSYSRETTKGISNIWCYNLVLNHSE